MTKTLKFITSMLHSAVYIVGLMTIVFYALDRRPFATKVTFVGFSIIVGCAFVWMVAVKPFLEGMRNEPNQALEPTSTAVTPPAVAGDRASGTRGSS
jgi:ascorbate-specific PTS system EIIC-type component UlaA